MILECMRNLPDLSTIFFQEYENCRRQESRSYGKVDGNWKLTFSPSINSVCTH